MNQNRQLPDWIDAFMTFSDNTEPPYLYRKWVAASTIAAVLQRKCVLKWGNIEHFPNMYVVLVGPAGRCRKGTAMKFGEYFLNHLGITLAANSTTREALIEAIEASKHDLLDDKTQKPISHCSITVYSSELTVFLGYDNKQLMTDLTNWYDCEDRWSYHTKNKGKNDIVGMWVNLIGATTPETIQMCMPKDAIGMGLTSRIVFVYEDDKEKTVVLPTSVEALREPLERDLESIYTMRGVFHTDDECKKKYAEWYLSHERTDLFKERMLAKYIERRPAHLWKLCMICNASRTDHMMVEGEDFDRALKMLRATEINMPLTFRRLGDSNIAGLMDDVMKYIAANKEVKYSQILQTFWKDADRDTMRRCIATLSGMKWCRLDIPTGGKGEEMTVTFLKQ